MSNDRRKQQRQDKKKKARAQAIARDRARSDNRGAISRERILAAAAHPHGPSFVSFGHDDPDPALVSLVFTRQAPGGSYLLQCALVDRTCLGVKSVLIKRANDEGELHEWVARVGMAHDGPMEPCELIYAQSILFHALDYARSLGFSPDPDFVEAFFGPRPAQLLDTPWARPAKPMYFSGPRDDVPRIMARLTRAVGAGNFEFLAGIPGMPGLEAGEDEDVIDAEGEEVP